MREKVHTIIFVHTCADAPKGQMIIHDTQGSAPMKYNMIRYQFANGTPEDWHREVARFIAALDGDPELKGKIGYRVMKNRDDSSYYHIATVVDDAAVKTLQSREFFKAYQAKTRSVAANGQVTVTPIEVIAETAG